MTKAKSTIREAILQVFKDEGNPLSARKIYELIERRDYYRFRSENPAHIVLTALRRRSIGLNLATSIKKKDFQILTDGTYWLKDKTIPKETRAKRTKLTIKEDLLIGLRKAHKQYLKEFKALLLEQLRQIEAVQFEHFARNLLKVYGFKNVHVTRKTKDGGIDGFGKLKLGIAELDVAFECKRWMKSPIPRKEVASFRGTIQGEYAQGIYFTTSRFTADSKKEAEKKGGAPIALIDGKALVDLMIEKEFGVEVEELYLYTSKLDEVLE